MSKIRGEYWIQDGDVNFADGDVGDWGHEAIATNYFANKHIDHLMDIAESLGVDVDIKRHEEYPVADTTEIRNRIVEAIENKKIDWKMPEGLSSEPLANYEPILHSVNVYLINQLGIDSDEYFCIFDGGDARAVVMEKEGWIAIRSNNIELYGFDLNKKKFIINGVEEILDQEGIEDPDEDIELHIYDYKTKRSWDTTLYDLKNESSIRPVTIPNTKYNFPLFVPPSKTSIQPSKTIDIKTRQSASTSESNINFKEWLKLYEVGTMSSTPTGGVGDIAQFKMPLGIGMVRRTWPFLDYEKKKRKKK